MTWNKKVDKIKKLGKTSRVWITIEFDKIFFRLTLVRFRLNFNLDQFLTSFNSKTSILICINEKRGINMLRWRFDMNMNMNIKLKLLIENLKKSYFTWVFVCIYSK